MLRFSIAANEITETGALRPLSAHEDLGTNEAIVALAGVLRSMGAGDARDLTIIAEGDPPSDVVEIGLAKAETGVSGLPLSRRAVGSSNR